VIEQVGGVGRKCSVSEYLQALIERLKNSNRLLIIDDAHFLNWEAFELVRKLHDCAGIGVVYVGQERLYEQMRGTNGKAYLFDQIYSRIAMKRDRFSIIKKDVQAIAESNCPGLDKDSIDFLYSRAKGQGRYRYITNLLRVAIMIQEQHKTDLSIATLQEAERFLLG
jgi:DNA transposition AAA+ family ATPase